ncbi:MAG: ABC transporter permease, partial [Candidatus Omnitrophica bacterium]|nr:ABC transporter permease [Candidatus Omnitrophota bacterium]
NAELPLVYAGKRHLKEKARERIEEVGLADRIGHRPNELSGGQQQRVAIARSLVNDPLILMADEPTGNLDSRSKEDIVNLLKELNRKGKTVIMVTHEQEMAAHAGRVIVMRDGKIISDKKVSPSADTVFPSEKDTASEGAAGEVIDHVLSKSERLARGAKFLDYLRQAGAAMITHKVRSFLSILGILIGVGAVIAMLAVGQGAKDSIEKELASLGSNLLIIRPGSAKVHGVAMEAGSVARFTFKDITAIEKLTDTVARVSPSVTGSGQLVYGNKNWNTQVEGVGTSYAAIRSLIPEVGRFFNEQEVKAREKVAVLGTTVVKELFGGADPVGEKIKINLINFRVIGILPAKGGGSFRDQDDIVLIPVTTAMYRVFGKDYINTIYVEAGAPDVLEEAQDSISSLIIKTHRLGKNREDAFQIRNMAEMKKAMENTAQTMSLLLGSIAAISLLVGGIGIMNIMLVSVTERTREIGLRKAIGANQKDIMVQFLIEAVLMSLLGGASGILLGVGTAALINLLAGWSVRIMPGSVALATAFSLAIGILFGLWPAKKAAELNPIEALRYE